MISLPAPLRPLQAGIGRLTAALGRGWRALADRFPWTTAGVLTGLVAAFALWRFAFGRQDLVLLSLALLALFLVVTSGLSVVIGAFVVRAALGQRKNAETAELEVGAPCRTGFVLPPLWWLPLVSVDWRWERPDATVLVERGLIRDGERVLPRRRGECDRIVRRFEVHDLFGLARVAFSHEEARRVRVLPGTGRLKQVEVVQGLAGGDQIAHPDGPAGGDPFDMRGYGAGDPIRFVLWKVYAKSRQLVVRTPERALAPVRQTVAYLVCGEADEAAAGAARVAASTGALGGDWVLGADGVDLHAKTVTAANEVILRSANATAAQQGAGLGHFLKTAVPGGVRRALVFVPSKPGPWLERVQAVARAGANGAPVDVIVCTDGLIPEDRRPWLWRLLWAPTADERVLAPSRMDEVAKICRSFGGGSGRVFVIDRAQGRIHAAEHLGNRAGRAT